MEETRNTHKANVDLKRRNFYFYRYLIKTCGDESVLHVQRFVIELVSCWALFLRFCLFATTVYPFGKSEDFSTRYGAE